MWTEYDIKKLILNDLKWNLERNLISGKWILMVQLAKLELSTEEDIVLGFTTPIVYIKGTDTETLNANLADIIRQKMETDPGVKKSNTGWHSQTDLATWDQPAIKEMFGLIEPVLRTISGGVCGKAPWPGRISYSAWANVNRQNQYNKMHNHPGFHWSGVYYVDMGDGDNEASESGKIEFQDPRGFASMVPMPGKPFGQTMSLKPKAGSLLIFPSFIYHAVTPYTGDDKRISIAFNASLQPSDVTKNW